MPPAPEVKTCATCKFLVDGTCHRYPPILPMLVRADGILIAMPARQDPNYRACGEYMRA